MISTKSFLHDRFFVNNSKHNLLKYNINVINNINCFNKITDNNVNILKQVFNLAIIKKCKNVDDNNRLFNYSDMIARFFGIMNNNAIYLSAFYNNYSRHHIEFKNQLHFEQNLLEYHCKISNCSIKKLNKYKQLWLINNCKKLTNN